MKSVVTDSINPNKSFNGSNAIPNNCQQTSMSPREVTPSTTHPTYNRQRQRSRASAARASDRMPPNSQRGSHIKPPSQNSPQRRQPLFDSYSPPEAGALCSHAAFSGGLDSRPHRTQPQDELAPHPNMQQPPPLMPLHRSLDTPIQCPHEPSELVAAAPSSHQQGIAWNSVSQVAGPLWRQPSFQSAANPSQQQISNPCLSHNVLIHQHVAFGQSLYAYPPVPLPSLPLAVANQPVAVQSYSKVLQMGCAPKWPQVQAQASASSLQLQPSHPIVATQEPLAINSSNSVCTSKAPSTCCSANESSSSNVEQQSPTGSNEEVKYQIKDSVPQRKHSSAAAAVATLSAATAAAVATPSAAAVATPASSDVSRPKTGSTAIGTVFTMNISPDGSPLKMDYEAGKTSQTPCAVDPFACLSVVISPLPPPPPAWVDAAQMPPRIKRQLEQSSSRRSSLAFMIEKGDQISAADRQELEKMNAFEELFEKERRRVAFYDTAVAQLALSPPLASNSSSAEPLIRELSISDDRDANHDKGSSPVLPAQVSPSSDATAAVRRSNCCSEPAPASSEREPPEASSEALSDAEWSRIGRERGVPASLLPLSLPLRAPRVQRSCQFQSPNIENV